MIFVGHDWSEAHHDVVVMDEGGGLGSARLSEGVAGVAGLHTLVSRWVDDPAEVVVGTETDRGLFVAAMVAVGYAVFAINPKAVDRYRDRHRLSGSKSDGAEALKVLTRAHKDLIWRRQGQINLPALRAAGLLPGCTRDLR